MDSVSKFLRKQTKKERLLLMAIIDLILEKKIKNLNIKKLAGYPDIFRVRVGKFRIIFKKSVSTNKLIKVSKRDDRTYDF